jgi:VWFA-related protein
MTRLTGVALGIAMAWLTCAHVVSQDRPQFRAGVDVVSIDVSVREGNRPVPGLTPADFAITDNGVAQQIGSLSIESLPVDVSLIVDVSNQAIGHQRIPEFVRDINRLASLLGSDDRLRLVLDASYVTEIVPMRPVGATWALDSVPIGGGTSSIDAVALTLMRPVVMDRRHLIVAFTEGVDYFSVLDHEVLPNVAKRSDALLYVVIAPIWTGGSPNRGRLILSAKALPIIESAELTGGRAHTMGKGLVESFKDVIDDFHSSYLLRYTPRGVTPGGWHDISVRMPSARASKYAIRARKGYFGR